MAAGAQSQGDSVSKARPSDQFFSGIQKSMMKAGEKFCSYAVAKLVVKQQFAAGQSVI